jgi:hypothetical protein
MEPVGEIKKCYEWLYTNGMSSLATASSTKHLDALNALFGMLIVVDKMSRGSVYDFRGESVQDVYLNALIERANVLYDSHAHRRSRVEELTEVAMLTIGDAECLTLDELCEDVIETWTRAGLDGEVVTAVHKFSYHLSNLVATVTENQYTLRDDYSVYQDLVSNSFGAGAGTCV